MPNRFVIASSPRTGSRMLASALARHSTLSVAGEIYAYARKRWLAYGPEINAETVAAVFEKYHGYVLHDFQGEGLNVFEYLPPDVRVIWLSRNPHDRAISKAIACKSGKWFSKQNRRKYKRFYLDPLRYAELVKRAADSRQYAKQALEGRRSIEVSYKQLTSEWPKTIRRICNFVGVGYELVLPTCSKQVPDHSALVSNYAEIVELVEASQ